MTLTEKVGPRHFSKKTRGNQIFTRKKGAKDFSNKKLEGELFLFTPSYLRTSTGVGFESTTLRFQRLGTGQNLSATRPVTIDRGARTLKKGGVETFFSKKIGGGDTFFEKNTFEIFENN